MKPKPAHILCLLGAVFLLSYGARAQEVYPMESTENERKGTYSPVDGDIRPHLRVIEAESMEYADADTSGYRTSAGTVQAGSRNRSSSDGESTAQQGNQESVLGFNFLYYIIQKFKMSDLVEK